MYAEVPVRVEYSLTTLGWTTTAPLLATSEWGEVQPDDLADARAHHRFAETAARPAGSARRAPPA